MSIKVALHHRTAYRYDRAIKIAPQTIRLRPAPHCRTTVVSYALNVAPKNHFLNWQQDPHGNFQARLVFPEPTRLFEISVDVVADMAVTNPFDFFLEPEAETYPFAYDPVLDEALAPFRRTDPCGPLLDKWLASVDHKPRAMIDFLVDLNFRLQREIGYVVRMEFGVQSPEETVSLAIGSCRDTGWLLVQILRHLGFAARFVSGYLIQLAADQKALDGPSGPAGDITDLHAWAEVYLPGSGWIGLDPTSGLLAGEGHLPLACTPEPASAAPVSGVHEPAEVEFEFDMSVRRISEPPRVTKPYDEIQWQEIIDLGRKVDLDLKRNDVRLTMGGEPTFVSVDDRESAQWKTAALGDDKLRYGGELLHRLAGIFAPGHMRHYGQGKWYPGEPLPRWVLGCYWRNDGEPIWRDSALMADPTAGPGSATAAEAGRFIGALATRLGINPSYVMPAYEDHWYYLWREKNLPVNTLVDDPKLDDPLERARLARLLGGELGPEVGYVLPLRPADGLPESQESNASNASNTAAASRRWRSARWYFRNDKLFLVPGDSPMGLRLPLDALPWVKPEDEPVDFEIDPSAPRGALPKHGALSKRSTVDDDAAPDGAERPKPGDPAAEIMRGALCVEVRNGHIHIFVPPVNEAADYLALVAALEATAAETALAVVIEGYPAGYDPRIETFSVTPDPGVLEVNIHPANNWDALVERTTRVYEEARATRLRTEKFMLDGRHTGTGGGNHFVIGGATPADSPLLRRPDLLRSLLAYWNNHPSLSYLFSGLFLGPTSQHPRVDEARDDMLYELEIAFQQIPGRDEDPPPPWLVDRLFRNLLVDVTGNAHRAEFCIDKLYTPESVSGRRGLLELRAFEMPPHSRMSLAQQLLLRALISWFWRQPYERPLVRWGTRLHDDFMMPHFVWQDFQHVVDDLNACGYPFESDWFLPQADFRFPLIGAVTYAGVELELRQALEPWHVLGEESVQGSTARSVDASLERLQVRVRGRTDTRYTIACNGYALPLRATGVQGEYVAGVRYRAWQEPHALHPTIAVHAPLLFDVYDSWSDTVLGGCTYHITHPGGRNYDTFPVNAGEAEARRRARFFTIGHTTAGSPPMPTEQSLEHPLTLDLRRARPLDKKSAKATKRGIAKGTGKGTTKPTTKRRGARR